MKKIKVSMYATGKCPSSSSHFNTFLFLSFNSNFNFILKGPQPKCYRYSDAK